MLIKDGSLTTVYTKDRTFSSTLLNIGRTSITTSVFDIYFNNSQKINTSSFCLTKSWDRSIFFIYLIDIDLYLYCIEQLYKWSKDKNNGCSEIDI